MKPDVHSRKKTITTILRHPRSVKGRWLPSAQKRMSVFKKHLGKVHLGSVGREETPSDNSFNRMLSSLSVSPNNFHFSANLDEYSELTEKAFNGDFLELPKRSAQTYTKNLAESSKLSKKLLFKTQSQNQPAGNKTSPMHKQCVGELQRKKVMRST